MRTDPKPGDGVPFPQADSAVVVSDPNDTHAVATLFEF
jgi:hypothetical protein